MIPNTSTPYYIFTACVRSQENVSISAAIQEYFEHILLLCFADQHQIKDVILDSPCFPHPWIKPGTSHFIHHSPTFRSLPPHYPPTFPSLPPILPPLWPCHLNILPPFQPSQLTTPSPSVPFFLLPSSLLSHLFGSPPSQQPIEHQCSSTKKKGQICVTNSQAATHESWRCSLTLQDLAEAIIMSPPPPLPLLKAFPHISP